MEINKLWKTNCNADLRKKCETGNNCCPPLKSKIPRLQQHFCLFYLYPPDQYSMYCWSTRFVYKFWWIHNFRIFCVQCSSMGLVRYFCSSHIPYAIFHFWTPPGLLSVTALGLQNFEECVHFMTNWSSYGHVMFLCIHIAKLEEAIPHIVTVPDVPMYGLLWGTRNQTGYK